jgi:DNA-directed RNA polymerase specialized sigma24 family protein
MKKIKKKPIYYVENADLLVALTKYATEYKLAKANNLELPRVPENVGKCIMLIANKLSNSPNFYRYSYKEDMVADGIENCLSYLHNFNPDKSKNAFAYITQICWYAAIRRITKEKKQTLIRSELIKNSGILNMDFDTHFDDDKEYKSMFIDFLQSNLENEKDPSEDKHGERKIIKKTTKTYQAQKKLADEKLKELEALHSFEKFSEEIDSLDKEEIIPYNYNDEFFE